MRRLAQTVVGFVAVLLAVIVVTPPSRAQPGRLVEARCILVDPPKEPRSLGSPGVDAVIQLTFDPHGTGGPDVFNLLSMTVKRGSLNVGIQFADGSIAVFNNLSTRTEQISFSVLSRTVSIPLQIPQTFAFSPHADNINRVTLEAIGNFFEVDDIVIEPAIGGGALTIDFDSEAALRAIPPPFTDAPSTKADRYLENGVLVRAGVDPPDPRLGGQRFEFYNLLYPPDVSVPCVASASSPPVTSGTPLAGSGVVPGPGQPSPEPCRSGERRTFDNKCSNTAKCFAFLRRVSAPGAETPGTFQCQGGQGVIAETMAEAARFALDALRRSAEGQKPGARSCVVHVTDLLQFAIGPAGTAPTCEGLSAVTGDVEFCRRFNPTDLADQSRFLGDCGLVKPP